MVNTFLHPKNYTGAYNCYFPQYKCYMSYTLKYILSNTALPFALNIFC